MTFNEQIVYHNLIKDYDYRIKQLKADEELTEQWRDYSKQLKMYEKVRNKE